MSAPRRAHVYVVATCYKPLRPLPAAFIYPPHSLKWFDCPNDEKFAPIRKVIVGHEKYRSNRCRPARSPRNPRMARFAGLRAEARRAGARRPPASRARHSRPEAASGCRSPPTRPTSTPSRRRAGAVSRAAARSSAASRASSAGTRWRWSCGPTRRRRRHRRPHLDVRLGRDAVRSRLQPLLPRPRRRQRRRHRSIFQGHALARHLRARVPRRPARRTSSWRTSAASCSRAAACRRIRTRG